MYSRLLILSALLLLGACGSGAGGGEPQGINPLAAGNGSGAVNTASAESYFSEYLSKQTDFCRSCHVKDGAADTAEGRRLQFTADPADDYDRLYAGWQAMGEGVDSSPLLQEPGVAEVPHSGGKPWPKGGAAYDLMRELLVCWSDPANCAFTDNPDDIEASLPLLGSRRGGHYWFDYCADKPDNTAVPQDPRELIAPGISDDRAVAMNAWWQSCQSDNHPGTCGELRARAERGLALVAAEGRVGAASFFSGDSSRSNYAFSASLYESMWSRIWELDAKPAAYDELVAQRWGMPLSKVRNPYPVGGEEPNETDGGTGQLPMGLTQLRETDGTWTGQINVTCSICHGGAVGTVTDGEGLGPMYGTNSLSDITVMFTDLAQLAPQQSALAIISQNKVRGTGNITNFQLFGTLTLADYNTVPGYLSIQAEPSTGTEDPPVWWNLGSRSAKFFDAGMVADAKRIELSFHFPNTPNHQNMEADKQWILDHQQDSDAWVNSLKSVAWPEAVLGEIDSGLAKAGAILFHAKNLWAPGLDNPAPEPERGNGSCASCHGAYSPRYVHDPAYLAVPELEGVAANVVPYRIINTDRARLDGNSKRVQDYSRDNWFAYSDADAEQSNSEGVPLCGNWADESLRGERELGYLAPPLYGVWATAPYFHNGSVPNIEAVLNPAARPEIWRRNSVAAPAGLEGKVVTGFDYSLDNGYDPVVMGWRHDVLDCGDGSTPGLDCNPVVDDGATVQDALSLVWGNGGLAWNLLNLPMMSDRDIEARKIYNTNYYSQNNSGHDFTAVLTDVERRAILEYLKTL